MYEIVFEIPARRAGTITPKKMRMWDGVRLFLRARSGDITPRHLRNLTRYLLGGPHVSVSLVGYFGPQKKIHRITRRDIVSYREAVCRLITAPETRRHYISACKSYFHWLRETEVIREDPTAGVKTGPHSHPPIVYLSDGERGALIAYLRAHTDKVWGLFGLILAETGARAGEVARLRWRDVLGDRVVLWAQKTKTQRVVPLPTYLRGVLQKARKTQSPDALVCPSGRRTGVADHAEISLWLQQARRRGPRFWWSWRVLRATYATYLITRGIPVEVVSRLLGHSTVDMTLRHYAHLRPEVHFRAVTSILEGDSI